MFKGVKILITAGPTREAIDPVRYISNHSTGKMGYAIAEEFHSQGTEVILVSGPVTISSEFPFDKIINVTTADEMLFACKNHFDNSDIVIFCAAVADFKSETVANQKIKKGDSELSLKLVPNLDIAFEFSKQKKANQIAIGFALETDNIIENSRKKLVNKKFNFIVINSPNKEGSGFGYETNKITILDTQHKQTSYELKSKGDVAKDLLAYIENNYKI